MASSEENSNGTSGKDVPPPQISADWVKVVAESIGISGSSTADEGAAYKYLAEDVTFRIKSLIQDAVKLGCHCNRSNLTAHDIDYTLKMNNYEPLYGFTSADYIPFRNASGGGRQLHFIDDKEVDLEEMSSKLLPKVPLKTSLRAHWLAIEGVQPTIPENPPPLARDLQKLEGINPGLKASINKLGKSVKSSAASSTNRKTLKDVKLKPLTEHDLSVEQQLYYKEITECCVGAEEVNRTAALASLAHDPGLHKVLPRLCTFISEGVKVNCVSSNLAILIYLMRMIKSLLENSSLYLEKYLHELIPAVVTCVVSKQLCLKPGSDNHWALRDFSSKLLGQLCRKFNSSTNDIQARIVKILSDALQNPKSGLSTRYGCILTLAELGHGAIQAFIMPVVRSEGELIRSVLETVPLNSIGKTEAQHLKASVVKAVASTLRVVRRPPDNLDSYRQEFGYLGSFIHETVVRLRSQTAGGSGGVGATSLLHNTSITSVTGGGAAAVAGRVITSSTQRNPNSMTLLTQHGSSAVNRSFSLPTGARAVSVPVTRSFMSSSLPSPIIRMSGGSTSLVRTPTTPNTPGSASGSQKFIIMSSTASSTHSNIQHQSVASGGTTIVKVVSASSPSTTNQLPNQQMSLNKALSLQAQAIQSAAAGSQSPNLLAPQNPAPPSS